MRRVFSKNPEFDVAEVVRLQSRRVQRACVRSLTTSAVAKKSVVARTILSHMDAHVVVEAMITSRNALVS